MERKTIVKRKRLNQARNFITKKEGMPCSEHDYLTIFGHTRLPISRSQKLPKLEIENGHQDLESQFSPFHTLPKTFHVYIFIS